MDDSLQLVYFILRAEFSCLYCNLQEIWESTKSLLEFTFSECLHDLPGSFHFCNMDSISFTWIWYPRFR